MTPQKTPSTPLTPGKILNSILWWLIWAEVALFCISWFVPSKVEYLSWSGVPGKIAIILLWIVSMPGILARFEVKKGVLAEVSKAVRFSRRRWGILMFVTALLHVTWSRVFFFVLSGSSTFSGFEVFEIFGIISFWCLVPLCLTSNNVSMKLLGKSWGKVHMLMYPVMWLLVLHISLQSLDLALWLGLPTAVIAAFQIVSLVMKSKKPQAGAA